MESNYSRNFIKSRDDLCKLLLGLCEPLNNLYANKNSRITYHFSVGVNYSQDIASIECFARILYGLGPYTYKNGENKFSEKFASGIIHGTNSSSNNYWGTLRDNDQLAVEMVPLALMLYFSKELYWNKFSKELKEQINEWFLQINSVKVLDCNWSFFPVIVNTVFKALGANYKQSVIDEKLKSIDKFYIGGGWYKDGNSNAVDYYVPWAFHYYGLIFSKLDEKHPYSNIFRNRAQLFAKDFIYWFDNNGSAIPFGRSLTYKFAQVAFWSACVYADVDTFSVGVVKGIILRNIRWWINQLSFKEGEMIPIGYAYPNLIMSEPYNSFGSSYWSFKTFLLLALGDKHPFWESEELPMPDLDRRKIFCNSTITCCRETGSGHSTIFLNRQINSNLLSKNVKYQKFVYSSVFGFSISRDYDSLNNGAFDSMLAVTDDAMQFRTRTATQTKKTGDGSILSKWEPYNDVTIETTIIPDAIWHVRIHKITTRRSLTLYECGYSIPTSLGRGEKEAQLIKIDFDEIYISKEKLCSGIKSLLGGGKAEIIKNTPNTNIIWPNTEMPYIMRDIPKGKHIIVSAILGSSQGLQFNELLDIKPSIGIKENRLEVRGQDYVYTLNRKGFKSTPRLLYKTVINLGNNIKNIIFRYIKR